MLEEVVSYIDGVLIHAPTLEQHDKILAEVLKRIGHEGITLNLDKCIFAKHSLIYLGHRISSSGISIDPVQTNSIIQFPK